MTITETDRLRLREFTLNDAPFILELLNTPGWLRFIGNRNMTKLSEAEMYISDVLISSYLKYEYGLYLVELKKGNTPVGMCGLVKRDYLEETDLGFALMPEYEGKGYALESAVAIINYTKQTLGLLKLSAITVKENTSSIKLLEKLNFKFEKTITSEGTGEELMLYNL
jgi:RimJ/RimL family protein N-acetyltransferase